MAKTSQKMAQARDWHDRGGRLDISIRTTYDRKRRDLSCPATRRIVYRVYSPEDADVFIELTKHQARRLIGPDMASTVDELEAVRSAMKSSNFGDQVDLNRRARNCARTKAMVDAWKSDQTVPVTSLMPPYTPAPPA